MWKLSIISTKSLFVSLSTCPEKRDTSSPLLSLRQPWGCRSDLYIWEGGGTCQTVHYQQGYWGKVSSFATNCLIDTNGYCLADRPAKLWQGLRLFLKQIASCAKSNRQRLKKAPCTKTQSFQINICRFNIKLLFVLFRVVHLPWWSHRSVVC